MVPTRSTLSEDESPMNAAYETAAAADPFARVFSSLTSLATRLSSPEALTATHEQAEADVEAGSRELGRLLLQAHLEWRARHEEDHLSALGPKERAELAGGRSRLEKGHHRQRVWLALREPSDLPVQLRFGDSDGAPVCLCCLAAFGLSAWVSEGLAGEDHKRLFGSVEIDIPAARRSKAGGHVPGKAFGVGFRGGEVQEGPLSWLVGGRGGHFDPRNLGDLQWDPAQLGSDAQTLGDKYTLKHPVLLDLGAARLTGRCPTGDLVGVRRGCG